MPILTLNDLVSSRPPKFSEARKYFPGSQFWKIWTKGKNQKTQVFFRNIPKLVTTPPGTFRIFCHFSSVFRAKNTHFRKFRTPPEPPPHPHPHPYLGIITKKYPFFSASQGLTDFVYYLPTCCSTMLLP